MYTILEVFRWYFCHVDWYSYNTKSYPPHVSNNNDIDFHPDAVFSITPKIIFNDNAATAESRRRLTLFQNHRYRY